MIKIVLIIFMVIAFFLATKRILTVLSDTEDVAGGKGDDKPLSKQKCENCAVGQKSYEIDAHSEACPFLEGRNGGECSFFVPLEKQ